MRRLALVFLVTLGGCGEVVVPDGGAPEDAAGGSDDSGARPDAAAPAARDRLGLFGPAPSFFELWLDETGAEVDRFHFGRTRSGFTWPVPLTGDFDGDGFDTVAFYDPRNGRLYLDDDERTLDLAPGGLPFAGDFDGDGVDGVGVYDRRSGVATFRQRADATSPETRVTLSAGGFVIGADLDGDRVDELVIHVGDTFRWTDAAGAKRSVRLGRDGLYPFAGDFDGNGVDGLGVYDVAAPAFTLWDRPEDGGPGQRVSVEWVNWVRYPLVGRWAAIEPRPAAGGYDFPIEAPVDRGVDPGGLADADAALDAIDNTRAFLVLTEGALIHEAYFHGNRAEIAHNIKSVSKSVLAALVSAATESGIDLSGPVYDRFGEIATDGDPRRDTIELAHLLTMTSGLRWSEPDIDDWFMGDDWLTAALTAPVDADPGATFNYSTALTHVASAALTRASSTPTSELARRLLFEPIGVRAERWDHDPQGTSIGGAEVTMRPRDLARFGQLMLEDGVLGGARVLPTGARDAILTEHVPPAAIDGDLGYGSWWWRRSFGGVAAWFAWGYGGQLVVLFPSARTVVVLTSRSDVTGVTATSVAYQLFDVVARHVVPALP